MDFTNPLWIGMPLIAALLTTAGLARLRPSPHTRGERWRTIDGLRGYLALGVLLHHAWLWRGYLHTGRWGASSEGQSALFSHLGQSSVALFFMITAFLFVGRLLDSHTRPIDWLQLYISRVLRLTPLYMVTALTLFTVCGALTNWHRHVPWEDLLASVLHWLFFTIGGQKSINGITDTFVITSGATWSLPLEWMFYLLLPTIALTLRRPTSIWLALITFVLAYSIWSQNKNHMMLRAFVVGGITAWLVRRSRKPQWATGQIGATLICTCLISTVLSGPSVYNWRAMTLISIAFALIASGNSLWGVLTTRLSRDLGELAYGIYLLHGLMLFISLQFVLGRDQVTLFTPTAYWLWLTALTPCVIAAAWLAHHWVELPSMALVTQSTTVLRKALDRLGGGRSSA